MLSSKKRCSRCVQNPTQTHKSHDDKMDFKIYLVSLVFILYLTSAIAYYQWVLYQVKTSQEKMSILNSVAQIKNRQTEEVYNATNLGHRNLTILEFLKMSASGDPNHRFVDYQDGFEAMNIAQG